MKQLLQKAWPDGLFDSLVDGHAHGDVGSQSADDIGNRFGHEHAQHAEAHPGQQQCQRHHNNRFSQQGEENRVPGVAHGLKCGLSGELERHENKAEEIDVHGFDARGNQGSVIGKDSEPEFGEKQYKNPCHRGVCRADEGIKADAGADSLVLLRAIVIADHRLRAAGQAHDRERENLPDGVGNRHDTNIQVSAKGLEGGVAGHLDQTVSALHDETGGT